MNAAPLPVMTPPHAPVRVTALGRSMAAGIAAACLVVLVLAAYLAPDPAGVGTTPRLGLPPCEFLQRTEIPCAGCGLTTSFNHFVRFEFLDAIWVQPLGFALSAAAALTVWVAGYVAATGRPVHALIARSFAGRGAAVVVGIVAFAIAAWGWKIALTLLDRAGTG